MAHPRAVTGVDPSAAFVDFARAHTLDDRARFEVGDAQQLPIDSGNWMQWFPGWAKFVPDQLKAVREMARVIQPGGTARRLCVGLCGSDADDARVLGCGDRALSRRAECGRGPPFPDLHRNR